VIDVPIARDRTDRKRMSVDRDGRNALTIVNVKERFARASLLDVDLRTGRTHQIRVHMAFIKHPILGDAVYGTSGSKELSKRLGIRRQQLHAADLRIALPSGGEPMGFTAPVPSDMQQVLEKLRSEEDTDA
jgi:23S rRNA pseudouridine1911/1915/1917 synthase